MDPVKLRVSKPRYVRDCVEEWIRDGRYSDNEQLPSEKEIADTLGISSRTVRKGLEILAQEKVIRKVARVGNFVNEIKSRQMVSQIAIVLPSYLNNMVSASPVLESWRNSMANHSKGAFLGFHPLVSCIQHAAHAALDPGQYQLTTLFYDDKTFWQDAGCILEKRKFDGALLLPQKNMNVDEVKILLESGVSVVCIQRSYGLLGLSIPCVHVNTTECLAQAFEHLHEIGHRNIMFVQYDTKPLQNEQAEVLERFKKRAGGAVPDDFIFSLHNAGNRCDYEVLDGIFNYAWTPTALVVEDEFIASLLVQKLYQRGYRIPEDISIVALTNALPQFFLSPLSSPDSLQLESLKIKSALGCLLKMIAGEKLETHEIVLPGNIKWTNSVRSLVVDDKAKQLGDAQARA